MTIGSAPTSAPAAATVSRPWLAEVWNHALKRRAARVGVVWIAAIAFFAVFAPLIANSHPILMKVGGEWSSPLLQSLTPVDVTLLFVGFIGVPFLFWYRRISFEARVQAVLAGVAVVCVLCFTLIHPPQIVVYERYREMQGEGQTQFILHTVIPYSPSDRLRDLPNPDPPFPWPPSRVHWLGTDVNGQDIASNMIHACRIAMSVGFISTGIAVVIAILIGGLMGYFAGWVDLIGMRLVEIFSSIPTIYLLLAFVAYFGRNIYIMMAIIGLTGWPGDARFIRAEFLKLRNQDFVQAAIAAGLPLRQVLFRHILPNAIAPLLVSASFGVASAILIESTLSFLGMGLIDEASWGPPAGHGPRRGRRVLLVDRHLPRPGHLPDHPLLQLHWRSTA